MKKLSRFKIIFSLLIVTMVGLAVAGGFLGSSLGGYLNRMEAEIEHSQEHEHQEDAHSFLSPGTYYKSGSNFYTRTSRTVAGGTIYRCTVCGAQGEGLCCYHNVSVTCSTCSGSGQVRNGNHSCSAQTGSHSCSAQTGSHSCSAQYGSHSMYTVYGNHYVTSSNGPHHYVYLKRYNSHSNQYQCKYCGDKQTKRPRSRTDDWEDGSCSSNVTYSCSYCGSTSSSSFSGTCYSHPTGSLCSYCGTNSSVGSCSGNITGYKCSYCNQTFSSNSTASCSSHVTGYKCSYCNQTFSSNSTASCSSHVTGYRCSKCGSTFSSNSTGACYKTCTSCSGSGTTTQNKDCATDSVGTAPSTTYYTYTNIDTGVAGSETTSNYSTATGFYVQFNLNNANAAITTGTTSGTMSNQYMLHGHSEALASNAFTFSGHRFVGWATSAGSSSSPSSVTYSNGQSINLTTSNVSSGGTYNLYAVWQYQVAKPTATGGTSYQYTAGTITHAVSNYNTTYMTRSGTYQATARGSYSITYALKTGFCWSDNTTSNVTLNWSIIVRTVTIPTVSGSFTYDGNSKSATISNTSSYYTQSGTASATNAGTHTVYFTLLNTSDYVWSDSTTAQKSGSWTIARAKLTIPTLASSPTYTGSAVSPTLNNFNSSLMTKSGDTSATNVKTSGSYTLTVSLTDAAKANYMWSDSTDAAKNISWNVVPRDIGDAGITITIPQDNFVYDGNPKTPEPTVTA